MIKKITTYMARKRRNKTTRTIRVSTVRGPGEPYETMVFEGDSGVQPVYDRGGEYCERGSQPTSLHQAAVDRFWYKGFRSVRTESVVE